STAPAIFSLALHDALPIFRALGVEGWDVSALTPNRRKFLSQMGKKSTNQALQRTPPERRYPILVAFLRQVAEELMDEVMDLFDRSEEHTSELQSPDHLVCR